MEKQKQFVLLQKRSKKSQREFYRSQRGTWGACNPVSRIIPNKKRKVVRGPVRDDRD